MSALASSGSDLDQVVERLGSKWERLRGKRIFLTGGTGFIGKWLLGSALHANRALGLGCELVVLSRDPQRFAAQAPDLATDPALALIRGDVREPIPPIEGIDLVIHAAADVADPKDPLETFDACALGTRQALECARRSGASKLLYVSSGAVYGRQPPSLPAIPEDWNGAPDRMDQRSAYGLGKLLGEWLVAQYGRQYGLEVHSARCFALVGPYLPMDRHFAIGNFIRDAVEGRAIVIQGDGTPLRTYLYAADMAVWLWAIAFDGAPGRAYNVGGAEPVSIKDLATVVNRALGTQVAVQVLVPAPAAAPAERYVPDVSRARQELGLDARVGLDEAIRRTARWYREGRHRP